MGDASIVWPDPVDEQEDDLIEAKANQKRQSSGNASMSDTRPIDLAPPLGNNQGTRSGTPTLVAAIMTEFNGTLFPAKELIHCVIA